MTTTFKTTTGSKYILDGNRLTRLSEKPMRGIDRILKDEFCEVIRLEQGRGFRALVNGVPLHTSKVVEITHG